MKYVGYFFLFILGITFLIIAIIHFNFFSIKDNAYKKYPNLNIRKHFFKEESVFNNLNNDYNVKFIPFTELLKFELQKKKFLLKKNTMKAIQKIKIYLIARLVHFILIYMMKI